VFERGEIRILKQVTQTIPLESAAPASVALQPLQSSDPLTVETTRT
jgi:hypothetical protein